MANFSGALQGGISGASAGASLGPAGAAGLGAAGLLAGFLGGPRVPPELKRLYRMQYGMADQLRRFAQSVPLSDPGEQAALASQRAQLGEQQRNQQGQLYAALNRNQGTGNMGDFLTNLNQQNVGQQMAVSAQHYFNALTSRRQALSQASQIGQAAASTYQPQQGPDFGALFGDISRLVALNHKPPPTGGLPGGGLPGGGAGPQLQMPAMNQLPSAGWQGGGLSPSSLHNAAAPSGGWQLPQAPTESPANLTLKWGWKQASGRK